MKKSSLQEGARLLNLGIEHLDAYRNQDALKILEQASRLCPLDVDMLCVLGHAQERMGQPEAGRESFTRAHKLNPRHALALRNLASAELNIGNAELALQLADAAYAIEPANQELASIMLLAATSSMSVSAEALRARIVHDAQFRRLSMESSSRPPGLPPLPLYDSNMSVSSVSSAVPATPIRIGYFSHHFYRFPLASFLPHVLRAHDRSRFRVFAFAGHGTMDDVFHQYVDSVDEFHDLSTMDDDAAACYIRELNIDVLLDLSGLTLANRFGILERRPARVQMSWLGYFSTVGSRAIDFHLTDQFANPTGMTEHLFTEKLLRLPDCQYAYRPLFEDVPVAPSPLKKNGYVTFGWFCAPAKLNETAIAAYAEIVANVPDSRIIFVTPSRDLQRRIAQIFLKANVKRNRLSFLSRLTPESYFKALSSVDINLDCFPMVGGTAVCDSVWMGTPVISMFLPRGFGGAASSILRNVGLGEWLATDTASFIGSAIRLAGAHEQLIGYRETLRDRLINSAVMDTVGRCRSLEQFYENALLGRGWESIS